MSFAGFGTALGNLLSGTANSLEDKQKREAMLQEVAMKMRAQQMLQFKDANDMQIKNAEAYNKLGYVPLGTGMPPQIQMPQAASFGIGAPPPMGAQTPFSPLSIALPSAASMPMGTGRPPETYPGAGFGFKTINGLTPDAAVDVAKAGAVKLANLQAEGTAKQREVDERFKALKEGIAAGELPELAKTPDAELKLLAGDNSALMRHLQQLTPAERTKAAADLQMSNRTLALQTAAGLRDQARLEMEQNKVNDTKAMSAQKMAFIRTTGPLYNDVVKTIPQLEAFENNSKFMSQIGQFATLANQAMQEIKPGDTKSPLDFYGQAFTAGQIANAREQLNVDFPEYYQYLMGVKRTAVAFAETLPRPNLTLLGLELGLSGVGPGAQNNLPFIKDVQTKRRNGAVAWRGILERDGWLGEDGSFIFKTTPNFASPDLPTKFTEPVVPKTTLPGNPTGKSLVLGQR